MRKYLRIIAKIIYLPFVLLKDFAELDVIPSLEAIYYWVRK